MTVVLSIEGLDLIEQVVDPPRFMSAIGTALDHSAEALRDQTKQLPPVSARTTGHDAKGIPVETGRMRQSVQKRRVALMAAEVYVGTNYGIHVHEGTSRVPSRPFFRWLLDDFQGREVIANIFSAALERLTRP